MTTLEDKLSMSLDDLVAKKPQSQPRRRQRGGRGGRSAPMANLNVVAAPVSESPKLSDRWGHDRFDVGVTDTTTVGVGEPRSRQRRRQAQRRNAVVGRVPVKARLGGKATADAGTKLLVSNLDFTVSDTDMNELFGDVGAIQTNKTRILYDKSGRSTGNAEIVFVRRADALSAIRKYNNVLLDGKPMNIILATASQATVQAAAAVATGRNQNRVGRGPAQPVAAGGVGGVGKVTAAIKVVVPGRSPALAGGSGRGRRRRRGGGGGGRGGGRGGQPVKDQGMLDAELDDYMAAAPTE